MVTASRATRSGPLISAVVIGLVVAGCGGALSHSEAVAPPLADRLTVVGTVVTSWTGLAASSFRRVEIVDGSVVVPDSGLAIVQSDEHTVRVYWRAGFCQSRPLVTIELAAKEPLDASTIAGKLDATVRDG